MQSPYRKKPARSGFKVGNVATGLLVAMIIALPIGGCSMAYKGTEEIVTATVLDKERISKGSGDSQEHYWLIYTENETFQNKDSLLFLKFNSADIQGHLQRGQTYRLKVVGWRIPFFSAYRNIIDIES